MSGHDSALVEKCLATCGGAYAERSSQFAHLKQASLALA